MCESDCWSLTSDSYRAGLPRTLGRRMERPRKRGKGNHGQQIPKARAASNNMGSLQRLREAADAMGWSVEEILTRVGGSDHSPSFRCDLHLCGRPVASEEGGSKQEAKERAAGSALNSMVEEPSDPFADKLAEMVRRARFRAIRCGRLSPLQLIVFVRAVAGAHQVERVVLEGAAPQPVAHSRCR